MRNAKLLHVVVLAFVACASPQPSHREPEIDAAANAPALAVDVREVSESLILSFDAVNVSSSEISVTPAFGYDFYFNLELEHLNGTTVRVPAWEITREIRGRCLRSGEKLSFRVPLERWDVVTGTDASCPEEPCFRVQLPTGTYRLRVRYRPVRESRLRAGCASVPITTSEWFRFDVREKSNLNPTTHTELNRRRAVTRDERGRGR